MAEKKNEISDDKSELFGFYRAKVVDNVDPDECGRIKVWIPDVMHGVSEKHGMWAMSANNSFGGRNLDGSLDVFFAGQCIIPAKGSYCWIFFECGNPNRPVYFGALDLMNSKVLPECRVGDNPQNKWVIFKSHWGRTIVVSDDPSDARVEITGIKRMMIDPPDGDENSIYEYDNNQTSILLDEREGQEKLLIRSWKGDFINFDIENQRLEVRVRDKLDLVANGDLNLFCGGDMTLKCQGSLSIQANDITMQSATTLSIQAVMNAVLMSWQNITLLGLVTVNGTSPGSVNIDAPIITELTGKASMPGPPTINLDIIYPDGLRDSTLI